VSGRKLWRNSLGGAEGSFAPLSPRSRSINVEIDTKYLIENDLFEAFEIQVVFFAHGASMSQPSPP